MKNLFLFVFLSWSVCGVMAQKPGQPSLAEKQRIADSILNANGLKGKVRFCAVVDTTGVEKADSAVVFKMSVDKNALLDSARMKQMKSVFDEQYEQYLCSLWIDKPCPDFALKDLSGRLWKNEDLKGKVTVINTWNIYCRPCKKEMPVLNQIMKQYPEYQFLAVSPDRPEQIRPIVKEVPFLFTQLAEGKEFLKKGHLNAYPVDLVIDKNGMIRHIIYGGGPQEHIRLKKALDAMK